jgi:hypothetical protein
MKHCIAVIEVLIRTVTVDTKETGEKGLKQAIECVKDAYSAQEIILDADDLVPNPATCESAFFGEADWIDPEEVQQKEADFTL